MNTRQIKEIVKNLQAGGLENRELEVKSNVGKSILETLSSFSNDNGGIIVVGLNEADNFRPVEGFSVTKAQDALITACDKLTPTVRPEIEIISLENGEQILAAEIPALPASQKPCYITTKELYNGSYTRDGEADRRLTAYEIDRLRENQRQPDWDNELIENATVKDLDKDLLTSYVAQFRNNRPRIFNHGELKALSRLHILRNNKPTLASLLTLGEYPQEFFPRLTVTFAHFPGSSKADIAEGVRMLSSETITGSIPELVARGVELVQRNMNTGALIEGVYRRDIPDYPLVAIREALVNALMHRDYSPQARNAQVQLNLYADRLEITSPGGLFGNVTLESIKTQGASSTRNPRIAEFLQYLQLKEGALAENRGTGIQIIEKTLAENLMPAAEFRNTLNEFTIIFYRRKLLPKETYLSGKEKIKEILKTTASTTTTNLVRETGLSRTAVQNALNSLITEGIVERTEPERSPKQRYRIFRG